MRHDRLFQKISLATRGLMLLMILLAPTLVRGADDLHWRPAETRVFIASLCWYKGEKQQAFPVDERLDGKMADFFLQKGLAKDRVKLLLDKSATVTNTQHEF